MNTLAVILLFLLLSLLILIAQNWHLNRRHRVSRECDHLEHLADLGLMAGGLAHEIRNPLNAITFGISALRDRLTAELGTEKRQDLIEIAADVESEIRQLNEILTAFLHYARPIDEDHTRFDIRELVEEVFHTLRSLVEHDHHEFVLSAKDGSYSVSLPRVRLREVLFNLILNAIQHSPNGSRVTVTLFRERQYISVSVSDEGPGVDLQFQQRLFQPFFSTRKGGTGLGLALSRRLVLEMGGDITFEPSQTGGSIFHVTIPRRNE